MWKGVKSIEFNYTEMGRPRGNTKSEVSASLGKKKEPHDLGKDKSHVGSHPEEYKKSRLLWERKREVTERP